MIDLEGKAKRYLELLPSVQDPSGFINSSHCDSLLFTGLLGCVPGTEMRIKAAYDSKTGMWHRRPTSNPCFDCSTKTNMGSSSTISRDMLLGLAWYAWHNKRLDISESVVKYAMKNWGMMGCAENEKVKWGRCQIMPPLFSTFCWISYKLGGPSRAWARWVPADLGSTGLKDFQAHLQVLHILLRSQITKKLSKREQSVLNFHAAREPRNPLFLHAARDDMAALEVLSDERLWPSDRLPRPSDRKTEWIPMRDEGQDWEPKIGDASLQPYSGGDFLFVWWLISQKYSIY